MTDHNTDLIYKAREHEQKKVKLLSKIRKNVSNSPLTQVVKDDAFIQRSISRSPAGRAMVPEELDHQTPPERDRSGTRNRSRDQSILSRSSVKFGSATSKSKSRSPVYKRNKMNAEKDENGPNLSQ